MFRITIQTQLNYFIPLLRKYTLGEPEVRNTRVKYSLTYFFFELGS